MNSHEHKLEKLIDAQTIQERIKSLAQEINQVNQGKELILVGILKGAFVFMADLMRHLTSPLTCDFLRIRSYDAQGRPKDVRLEFDLTQPITHKHVLVIEDIVDTGSSFDFIKAHLLAKHPLSLQVCALLQKEKKKSQPIDFIGFNIKDHYVVGYGMDLDGRYRHLPYIAYLRDK